MFNFDHIDQFTAELTVDHLSYHYSTNTLIILAVILIGIAIYGLHLLQNTIHIYIDAPEKINRVKIPFMKFLMLNEMQIFAISILCTIIAEYLFRAIGLPALHHYSMIDELRWIRVNTGLSILSIVSFASYLVLYTLTQVKYDKDKIEGSINGDKIHNLILGQKLSWLLVVLVILDITSIYIFWLSI